MVKLNTWDHMRAYARRLMAVLTEADILEYKIFGGELVSRAGVDTPLDIELVKRVVRVAHLFIHRSMDSGKPKPTPVYRDQPFRIRLRYLLETLC